MSRFLVVSWMIFKESQQWLKVAYWGMKSSKEVESSLTESPSTMSSRVGTDRCRKWQALWCWEQFSSHIFASHNASLLLADMLLDCTLSGGPGISKVSLGNSETDIHRSYHH